MNQGFGSCNSTASAGQSGFSIGGSGAKEFKGLETRLEANTLAATYWPKHDLRSACIQNEKGL